MIDRTEKNELTIACFIDAFGWEVVKETDFLAGVADHRYRLRTVFGYSNAAIPSILSGRKPNQHQHWTFYYYAPQTSPFADLRWLRFIPKPLAGKHRLRNKLSQWVKHKKGFTGYFQLYNVPFQHIHLFDYCEKRDYFKPGGLNQGTTIFDTLHDNQQPYTTFWDPVSDKANVENLWSQIDTGTLRFAYLHLAQLDGALHETGKGSPEATAKLNEYDAFLRETVSRAKNRYDKVKLLVFGDHGMAEVTRQIDLIKKIEATGLDFGEDYVAFYDSTTARFWFHSDAARATIESVLGTVPEGRLLPDAELKELGVLFDDRRYGEAIFLLQEGVLIVPSFMGEKGIAGMHGYHPDDADSWSALMTSDPPATEPTEITDIHDLMLEGIPSNR